MSGQLRFGFVGAGETAVHMAKGVVEAGNAQLAWVTDIQTHLAEDLAGKYQAKWTTSLDEMLAQPEVDAVYLALPHFLYLPICRQVAAAGKHMLIEKPMGSSLAEAQEVAALAQAAGVFVGVCFPHRYFPTVMKAREIMQAGLLGDLQGVRITVAIDKPDRYWQGGYSGRSKNDWRTSKAKSGGGVMLINCIHNLDAIYHITGLVGERAYAEYGTFATNAEVEDLMRCVIRYQGGPIGIVDGASALPGASGFCVDNATRIYGISGQLVISKKLHLYTEIESTQYKTGEWQEVSLPAADDPFTHIVRDFSAALLRGETPPTTAADALRAFAIVDAGYRSQEAGQAISCNVSS